MLSFLNIDRATEMKLRLRKAKAVQLNNRALKIINENRVRRYEEALSTKQIVADVLSDCVDAVCALIKSPRPAVASNVNMEGTEVTGEQSSATKKRSRRYDTWHSRCYAIYLLLHPGIFNGDAHEASETLGIARTTLLGWVSKSVKRNCVPK